MTSEAPPTICVVTRRVTKIDFFSACVSAEPSFYIDPNFSRSDDIERRCQRPRRHCCSRLLKLSNEKSKKIFSEERNSVTRSIAVYIARSFSCCFEKDQETAVIKLSNLQRKRFIFLSKFFFLLLEAKHV